METFEYSEENDRATAAVRIAGLINRLRDGGRLSEEEDRQLDGWLAVGDNRRLFERLMDREQVISDVRAIDDYDKEAVTEAIFGRLGLQYPIEVKRGPWLKTWASAAAVLVLVAGAIWILMVSRKGAKMEVASSVLKKDILPGSDKATLTLGNGSSVALSGRRHIELGIQGDSRLTDQGGHLTYEFSGPTSATEYNTVATAKGGQYAVTLPDGSRVWLNAASSLKFPTTFSRKERMVQLTGEAFFDLVASKDHPFRIEIAGKGEIEVLGTRFNVNAYDDEPSVKTTLVEGALRVNALAGGGFSRSVVLSAGQQALLDRGHITVANDFNAAQAGAWKEGYFSFSGMTLEEIMRQVGRWYDAEIVYEGDVKNERFAGSALRSANASRLLEVLALTKTVQFTIEDKKIIVKPYHP
ncbi:MAG TPA: FecR domain-containing protein [Puia sp.]|nr:FecR domain-containing protein [Puia sp.]